MTTASDNEEPAPAGARRAASGGTALRWLLQATGIEGLKRQAGATARYAGLRVGLAVAAGILWLLVAGFLLGALVVWLSGVVGVIAACGIVAAVFAVAALVIHAVAAMAARRRQKSKFNAAIPGLAEGAAAGAFQSSALGALIIAVLAGLFVGLKGKP